MKDGIPSSNSLLFAAKDRSYQYRHNRKRCRPYHANYTNVHSTEIASSIRVDFLLYGNTILKFLLLSKATPVELTADMLVQLPRDQDRTDLNTR